MMDTLTWVYNVLDPHNHIVQSCHFVHDTGNFPVDAESLRKAV